MKDRIVKKCFIANLVINNCKINFEFIIIAIIFAIIITIIIAIIIAIIIIIIYKILFLLAKHLLIKLFFYKVFYLKCHRFSNYSFFFDVRNKL